MCVVPKAYKGLQLYMAEGKIGPAKRLYIVDYIRIKKTVAIGG